MRSRLVSFLCCFAFVGCLSAANNYFGVAVNGACETGTSCYPPVPLPYSTANTLPVTLRRTLPNGDKYLISGESWGSNDSNGGDLPFFPWFQVTYEGNATSGTSAADTITVDWYFAFQTTYGYGNFSMFLVGAFSPTIAASSSLTGCTNGTACLGPVSPPSPFSQSTGYSTDSSNGAFDFDETYVFQFGAGSPVGSSIVMSLYQTQTSLPPGITSFSPKGGKPGAGVTIAGTNLSDVLEVSFNGVNSSFTVVSDTEISAAVPPGAATGPIQVLTPGGLVKSSGKFAVEPPSRTGSVTVNAVAEISGAGFGFPTTWDYTGILPPGIALPAGATHVTFSITGGSLLNLPGYGPPCTAPCITVNDNNGFGTYNDADGVGSGSSLSLESYGALSGIIAPNAGFVAGVFESGGTPSGNPPPTLDFTSFGINFVTLSPQLNQLFFIGDGLTGDGEGTVQRFYVPSGATVLYLGIPDDSNPYVGPSAYDLNVGDLVVSYKIATAASSTER